MKFRRIPETIEAVRFDPCGAHRLELPEGVKGRLTCPYEKYCKADWSCPCCQFWMPLANDRWCAVRAGDWVVTENDHVNRIADRGDGLAPLGCKSVDGAKSIARQVARNEMYRMSQTEP